MESNYGSVWNYYQQGWVDPLYVPYLRELIKDRWGNTVSINSWEKNSCLGSMTDQRLMRINKGMSFMRMFEQDPCPPGWVKVPGDDANSMCVQNPLVHEPVFYTSKAFIPQRQFWDGPAEGVARQPVPRRISEQTDMRSVNPLDGHYHVDFQPIVSESKTRYYSPVNSTPGKYDHSWNLARGGGYASMPTTDSYLA